MKNSYYLPTGYKLGGHYEIVKVLGEDEFEILYLVRDLHMGEKNFVLKELFLSAYTSRNEDNSVQIMAKSKQIFEQTKRDVISEIDTLKKSQSHSPQLYGYFEENHTLYTIMEFINSSNLSAYLELNSEDKPSSIVFEEEKQPTPKVVLPPIIEEKKKNPSEASSPKEKAKSTIFLKLLIVGVLIIAGLLFYSYNMIQKDKEKIKNRPAEVIVINEPIHHPPLEDKVQKKEEENLSMETVVEIKEEKKEELEGAAYIEEGDMPLVTVEDLSEIPKAEIYVETEPNTNVEQTSIPPKEQTIFEEEIITPSPQETVIFEDIIFSEPKVIEYPAPSRGKPNISLGTRIN